MLLLPVLLEPLSRLVRRVRAARKGDAYFAYGYRLWTGSKIKIAVVAWRVGIVGVGAVLGVRKYIGRASSGNTQAYTLLCVGTLHKGQLVKQSRQMEKPRDTSCSDGSLATLARCNDCDNDDWHALAGTGRWKLSC